MGVQQQSPPTNKTKAPKPVSEARRIRKPLMERKRRERINTSLNDLASLLTEAKMVKSEPGKTNKLEKADILELTVKHIRTLKTQEKNKKTVEGDDGEEQPLSSSYTEGFTRCMGVVEQTLSKAGKEDLRQRLLTHLKSCLQKLQPPTSSTTPQSSETSSPTDASVRLAPADSTNATPTVSSAQPSTAVKEEDSPSSVSATQEGRRLTLVPTRLPSGGVAFLIQGEIDPSILVPQEQENTLPASPVDSSSTSSSGSSITPTTPTPTPTIAPQATCPPTPPPIYSEQPTTPPPTSQQHPSVCHPQPPTLLTYYPPTHSTISHSPPTPPPSVSPQNFHYSYQTNQLVSSEEEMDTDETMSDEEDIDVENDGPYDLSMRRMWRPW